MKDLETTDTALSSASRQTQDKPAPRKSSRRTSRTQRATYLRQWEASGLSAEAFAVGRPIKAQSLYRWRMTERSANASGAIDRDFALREIKLAEVASPFSEGKSVTLRSPGLEATLHGYALDELLPRLVQAMREGRCDV